MGGAFTALPPAFLQPTFLASGQPLPPVQTMLTAMKAENSTQERWFQPPALGVRSPPCTDIADSYGLPGSIVLVKEHAAQHIQKQTDSIFFSILPLQHQLHSQFQYLSPYL